MDTRQLRLITTQKYAEHDNTEEMQIEAIVAKRGASTYITFKQPIPDTTLEVSNIVKIKNGVASVKRSGAFTSNLEFDITREYLTDYETPYGQLDLRIITHGVESFVTEETVHLEISYEMHMQGRKVSDNIYTITNK